MDKIENGNGECVKETTTQPCMEQKTEENFIWNNVRRLVTVYRDFHNVLLRIRLW